MVVAADAAASSADASTGQLPGMQARGRGVQEALNQAAPPQAPPPPNADGAVPDIDWWSHPHVTAPSKSMGAGWHGGQAWTGMQQGGWQSDDPWSHYTGNVSG